MGYFLPDPRFETPELFIPGKKPVGQVEINTSHHLAKNLCCLAMPDPDHQFELVTGNRINLTGTANFDAMMNGNRAGESKSGGNNRLHFAPSPKLYDITTNNLTIITKAALTSHQAYGGVVCIPAHTGVVGWNSPWITLNFGTRGNGDLYGKLDYSRPTETYTANPTDSTNFWVEDSEPYTYAVSTDEGAGEIQFYRDGASIVTLTPTMYNMDWVDEADVGLGGSDYVGNKTDEGVNCLFEYVMIFDKTLTAAEHASIAYDPYQLVTPARPSRIYINTAAPVGGVAGHLINGAMTDTLINGGLIQ